MTKDAISGLADLVRDTFKIAENSFDIARAVNMVGGEVKPTDSADFDACIYKNNENPAPSFTILVSERDISSPRGRFSIAHELGHFFMHMLPNWENIESKKYFRVTDQPYSKSESDANYFAACFLMPASNFIQVAETTSYGGNYYLREIADEFGVSVEAVNIRGRTLGLWG